MPRGPGVSQVYRLLGAGTIEARRFSPLKGLRQEQVYVRQVWKQQLAAMALDGTRSARRLDDQSFGLSSLFQLHDASMLWGAGFFESCLGSEGLSSWPKPSRTRRHRRDWGYEAGIWVRRGRRAACASSRTCVRRQTARPEPFGCEPRPFRGFGIRKSPQKRRQRRCRMQPKSWRLEMRA